MAANAGAVTKVLKNAGFLKAEWKKVGVSVLNEGFLTNAEADGSVTVSWELVTPLADVQKDQERVPFILADITNILTNSGYTVKGRFFFYSTPYLEVRRA